MVNDFSFTLEQSPKRFSIPRFDVLAYLRSLRSNAWSFIKYAASIAKREALAFPERALDAADVVGAKLRGIASRGFYASSEWASFTKTRSSALTVALALFTATSITTELAEAPGAESATFATYEVGEGPRGSEATVGRHQTFREISVRAASFALPTQELLGGPEEPRTERTVQAPSDLQYGSLHGPIGLDQY